MSFLSHVSDRRLAVAIPIALHLFRRKTDAVVEFPAVHLIEKAPVERQRRRRLRELILLALRVTALVLLAVAFASVFRRRDRRVPAPTTVVARRYVAEPVGTAPVRRAARVAAPPSSRRQYPYRGPGHICRLGHRGRASDTNRGAAVAALDRAQPTAGGTRFRTAVARAAEAVASGNGRIVVVSDLQQVGWERQMRAPCPTASAWKWSRFRRRRETLAVTTAS